MTTSLTFDQFYREVQPLSLRYVSRRFRLPVQDGEDIVQSSLIAFWQKHPNLEALDNPFAYFRVYLEFDVLTWLQKRRRQPVQESLDRSLQVNDDDDAGEQQEWSLRQSAPSVEATVLARLQWQEVQGALAQLPKTTQLITRFKMLGYDNDEIQQQMRDQYGYDRSLSRIEQNLGDARAAIRQQTQIEKGQRLVSHVRKAKLQRAKWSRQYTACLHCGTTTTPYGAFGLCEKCYFIQRGRDIHLGKRSVRPKHQWSIKHVSCVTCGTTDVKHKVRGLCLNCYRQERHEREVVRKHARLHLSS